MDSVKISIYGSCISRDAFNYDYDRQFQIETYINFNSFISQMSEPLFCSPHKVEHKSAWFSKIISTDINKNAFDLIKNDNADFLVIDLMSERLQLLKVPGCNGNNSFITLHSDLMLADIFTGEGIFSKEYISSNSIYGDELTDEFLNEKIRAFSNKILQLFRPENIIYIETFKAKQYVAKDGSIKLFSDKESKISKTNSYLLYLQNMLLYYLKGCHIIKFPFNTIADENHHLHLSATHFCENYYQYVLERIKNICFYKNDVQFESCNIMQKNNKNMLELINRRINTPQLSSAVQIYDKVIVTWTHVFPAPKSYKIYKDQGQGWKLIGESNTNFFFDELSEGKNVCRYTVRADYGTHLSTFDQNGVKLITSV